MRSANRSWLAKIHASCIMGCLGTLMACGKGALVGCVGMTDRYQLTLLNGVWERYGEICTAPASARRATGHAGGRRTNCPSAAHTAAGMKTRHRKGLNSEIAKRRYAGSPLGVRNPQLPAHSVKGSRLGPSNSGGTGRLF
jgi:hypothetical protein